MTSHLASPGLDAVAVIIGQPSPAEVAPVLMLAYGLTRQEQTLTLLVCRGLSTREIAEHWGRPASSADKTAPAGSPAAAERAARPARVAELEEVLYARAA